MAASALGGATTAARHTAESVGGGSIGEAAGFIVQRQKAQLAKATYQAQLLKLELEERRGHLRPTEEVAAALSRVAASMRRVLRSFPSHVENIGIQPDDIQRISSIVKVLINQLTMAMAKELTNAAEETEKAQPSDRSASRENGAI